MIRVAIFAFNFLINLRIKQLDKSVPLHIRSRYGDNGVQLYRAFEKSSRSLEKNKLDLDFLTKCKVYNIFPKFLRFKLYKRSLQTSKFYKAWQSKLLVHEINFKKRAISSSERELHRCAASIKSTFSLLDTAVVRRFVQRQVDHLHRTTVATHCKKLESLGVNSSIQPCDPDSVIFNFSSVTLSPRLRILLAYGLEFCLPSFRLNFYKYFLSFERLSHILKGSHIQGSFSEFLDQLKALSFKYYYGFKSYKIFSSVFTKKDIVDLKNLAANKNIIVSKPDKGRGVVLVDRAQYVESMNDIISDRSKFEIVDVPVEKYCTRIEDKINNFLRKLKNFKLISSDLYKQLFVSGSAPGILYGLPKIHKPNFAEKFQFRPIFAAYNTPGFGLAKYLVPILSPLTSNEYTVQNSRKFGEDISKISSNQYYMASFDVDSLFTNVPLRETINICLQALFVNPTDTVCGLTKKFFTTLLELSVLNSFFIFNNQLYKQVEGLGMGLPLGPTFANIFMCYHEQIWLRDCPDSFRPVFYRRYVDDTFLLFEHSSHAPLFLEYLNNKHNSIRFTMETEINGKLPFLDCCVSRNTDGFDISVYRKETFSGQGISYFSFCSFKFKINSIKTLLFRGYNICSNYFTVHEEFQFLKNFFISNGFPSGLINTHIKKFLDKQYSPSIQIQDIPRNIYLSIPYFGVQSEKLKHELNVLLSKYFTEVNFRIVLTNNFRIGSFFHYKDPLPKAMQSSLVYKFSCSQCESEYVGSTIRNLYTRVGEHAGRSARTGAVLACPSQSSIRCHTNQCSTDVSIDSFQVLDTASSVIDLRILESLYIYKLSPVLNDTNSAFPLTIIHR